MEKKITKRERFERLIEIVEANNVENAAEYVAFLENEIALVSKKRSGQTKTQKENEVLVEKLYEVIAGMEAPATVTEIYEVAKGIEGFTSPQKVSALVKKLLDAERVVKTTDKRKSLFSVAE